MKLAQAVLAAREANDPEAIINAIPYADLLQMSSVNSHGERLYHLPPNKGIVGNPTLPAIHGGALAGFMEVSAVVHLLLNMETLKMPKTVDFSVDYIRAGFLKDTYVACNLVREGRKLANVHIEAWQENRNQPIARARVHFVVEDVD